MKKVKKTITKKANKEVDCLWGLICSLSSIDQQINNISLFNVISEISLPSNPFSEEKKEFFAPMPHELVVVFRRTVGSFFCTNELVIDIKVSLIDPKGNVIHEILTPIPFKIGLRTMRSRFQMPGFKLTDFGDYVYRIEIRQPDSQILQRVNEIPFEVKVIDKS